MAGFMFDFFRSRLHRCNGELVEVRVVVQSQTSVSLTPVARLQSIRVCDGAMAKLPVDVPESTRLIFHYSKVHGRVMTTAARITYEYVLSVNRRGVLTCC